uniref:DnaJ-like protein subfamily B member 12 n=1 Tax=Noccaea caerulescens TaxID=107243 RepID=A0A1J3GFD3_NOCCA
MECNKDEAERAKEIAEKKFKVKDFAGAKKFALKAQSLYPEVESVSQMLATFDVYIAAENKVNEDLNWYGILDASPRDDDETLKRKYRKLALTLHPDKNSSIGSEGAFKYVLDAWKFLSDKEKRAAYDRKRSLQTMYQKVSVSASNNGFCNFGKTNFPTNGSNFTKTSVPTNGGSFAKTSVPANGRPAIPKNNPTTQKNNPQKPVGSTQKPPGRAYHHTTAPSSFTASGSSGQSESSTFWTVCRRCMMQYEYPRAYVNFNLLCANCRQPFLAIESPKPGMSNLWSSLSSRKRNLDPKSAANQSSTSGVSDNSKWTFSRTSSAAHAASVVQQAYEKVKKEREEAKATARRDKKSSKRKSTADSSPCGGSLKKTKVTAETDMGCSSGSKVTYHVSGETGKLQHGIKEIADEISPGIKEKISEEDVAGEVRGKVSSAL